MGVKKISVNIINSKKVFRCIFSSISLSNCDSDAAMDLDLCISCTVTSVDLIQSFILHFMIFKADMCKDSLMYQNSDKSLIFSIFQTVKSGVNPKILSKILFLQNYMNRNDMVKIYILKKIMVDCMEQIHLALNL